MLDYHSVEQFLQQGLFYTAAINVQGTTVLMIVLFVLLFLSFVLSGAEVAFFSLSYKDVNVLKTKSDPACQRIVDLLEEPKKLLGSLLIGNSFVNIAIIIISNLLIDELFDFEKIDQAWIEFVIKVLAVSFVLVLFGEVMPKVLATQNNIRFAKDFSLLVQSFVYATSGLSNRLVAFSDYVEKRLAKTSNAANRLAELDQAIDLTNDNDASEKEKSILKGIVKFGNITVKQIMRTRLEVVAIDEQINFKELITSVEEHQYSRVPVYREDIDNVVGMIHSKDLLPHLNEAESFEWKQLLRPAYFVHEQKMIEDLLQEFQQKRIHFAVVVDEFGGTSGIVTMEDILEEVIGEIKDEFDEEESGFKKLDDYNYIIEGRNMIHDVCRFMGLPLDTFDSVRGDSDSLGGLIFELSGDIPSVSQVLTAGDFEFTVLELERNRVKRVKITIQPQTE